MTKIFHINKGINRPIEFRGLKAQYIFYLAACVVGTLAGFGVLYACGVSLYVCTPLALGLGGWAIGKVFRMNKQYGQHGLMKRNARRRMPMAFLSRSRKVFIQLRSDYVRTTG
jgi:predicted RND superfamily exporter protein